ADDGDDCDDLNAEVNPDADEVCGDGIDNDCDGGHNTCDWAPTTTLDTVRTSTLTFPLTDQTPHITLGDANGDGAVDLAAWLPSEGDLLVFFGPWSEALTPDDADVTLALTAPHEDYPYAATMEQDLSGDGAADLVVGTWRPTTQGAVRVYRDLEPGEGATRTESDAWRTWTGPNDTSQTAPALGFGAQVGAARGRHRA